MPEPRMVREHGEKLFKPGERVQTTGIYRVLHHEHRKPHEATLRANDIFPSCKQCGNQVRFVLLTCAGELTGGN
jgi:hypothetical protein